MHEILTTTRANLSDRAAELESLIKDGEERCQAIADEGNRQIKVITDKAGADIGAVQAELEKHATELAGVQHSIGTIDAIADATQDEGAIGPLVPVDTPHATLTLDGPQIVKSQPRMTALTDAETSAAMRLLQQKDDRQQVADPYTTFIGGGGLPEKKKP